MSQSCCLRCRTDLPPSELIGGYCVPCKMKGFETTRKILPLVEIFAAIYKFAPILAGSIALLYLILNLYTALALTILIAVTIILIVISLLGMIPRLIPDFSLGQLQERESQFRAFFEHYVPSSGSACVNHPDRAAVGRCDHCYQPFCADEFVFVLGKPTYCRKCAPLIPTELNFWAGLNGLFSIGILAFAGTLNIVRNFGAFSIYSAIGLLLGFLIPFGIFAGFLVFFVRMNRQIKAQLAPQHVPI